jgi:hypothetical protein
MKYAPVLSTEYVVGDGPITLSVVIGNKQLGASLVKVGTREVARGDVTGLNLGKGVALKGQRAVIKAIVTDINDQTDLTTYHLELLGGLADARHDLSMMVDQPGDSVVYRVHVDFV